MLKEILRKGNTIKLDYSTEGVRFGDGFIRYTRIKEGGNRFEYGLLFKEYNGINLSKEEVNAILETKEKIFYMIKSFFNRKDLVIEQYQYVNFYIKNKEVKELEKLSEDIYNKMKRTFFQENQKFFKETKRIVKAMEDDVIFYCVQDEKGVERIEFARELRNDEKDLEEGTIINGLVVYKRCIDIDDIDYGLMDKNIKCLGVRVYEKEYRKWL